LLYQSSKTGVFAPMPTHLVSNYSEMGIHMLENILPTRCMALVSIVLQMGIGMREPGMRVEGKAWEVHIQKWGDSVWSLAKWNS
jgi:hypothetical protein